MVTPTLLSALEAMLPPPEHAHLIRACLATGDVAREAWQHVARNNRSLPEWFRTDHGDFRRLGPMLAWNLRRNNIESVDQQLLTVLRTSLVREELRSKLYRKFLDEVVTVLAVEGVDFIAVAGADLGATVYPEPALRHAHDIDLVVAPGGVQRAAKALVRSGYRHTSETDDTVVVRHERELPVRLVNELFHLSCHPSDWLSLRAASRMQKLGERSAQVLSREDALAFVLGKATYADNRMKLQWACDAWLIASQGPLNAERVVETLERGRLLLPAYVLARYLADVGAPLDADLLARMHAHAMQASRFDRDLALHALRRSTPGGMQRVLSRVRGHRAKVRALAWTLFPTREYIQWAHSADGTLDVSVTYVTRILKAAGG